jgi:hypothetical protein
MPIEVRWTPEFVENCAWYCWQGDIDDESDTFSNLFEAITDWCGNVSNEPIEQIMNNDSPIPIYGFSNVGECVVRIIVPFRAWFESLDADDQAMVTG